MRRRQPVSRSLFATLLALALTPAALSLGCSDDGSGGAPSTDAVGDSLADAGGDAGGDAGSDAIDPDTYTWPVALQPLAVPASSEWRADFAISSDAWDPFVGRQDGEFSYLVPRWVKATVVLSDPEKVYFQDSKKLLFHNDFVRKHLPPYKAATDAEIAAAALREDGQKLAFAVVLLPPDPSVLEFGVQLIRDDAIHPEMVRRLYQTVVAHVKHHSGSDLDAFYMPTYAQAATAKQFESWLAGKGVQLSDPGRWGGPTCYADGWAVGRLVRATAENLQAKVAAGEIAATDVLLLDAVPAEVPIVAGLLTESPTTPNSHAALLAQNLGIPFAPLSTDADRAAAAERVGQTVLLRARSGSPWDGGCEVLLRDAAPLGASKDALLALKKPAPLDLPAMQQAGTPLLDTKGLGKGDAGKVGGKAAGYGVLRAALPQSTRHAAALTFDVWNAFLDAPSGGSTLRAALAAELKGLSWPVAPQTLAERAAKCRALIEQTPWPAALGKDVVAALQKADFAAPDQGAGAAFLPTMKLRFRSSTNVEDSATFSGAGLYDSYSGCLADDLDADEAGPSACDPGKGEERGALRAIRRVYASFYNDRALGERLRHGVEEAKVGMAVLVHRSFPDALELANGVATLRAGDWSHQVKAVTQQGALSVTNAAPGAEPELVDLYISKQGEVSPTFHTGSSLLPLGAKVMTWPGDYVALGKQLFAVQQLWQAKTNESLDFEYKRVDVAGGSPTLVLKQVRPLPSPQAGKTAPFLLGDSLQLCTFEGEAGDVWEIARGKLRLEVTLRAGAFDPKAAPGLLAALKMRHRGPDGTVVETAGSIDAGGTSTLAGWKVTTTVASGWEPPHHDVAHAFTAASAAGTGATYSLRARLPEQVGVEQALLPGNELQWELVVTHPSPVPYLDWNGALKTREQDIVRLWACPSGALPAGGKEVSKTVQGPGGLEVSTTFRWPAPPKGPTAGYTAPNIGWVQTTLKGLTTTPLVLTSDFAQHQRPGHHNFDGMYLFEPRLDLADTFGGRKPSVTAAQLAELEKAGIVAIYVHEGADISNAMWIGKADGSWSKAE
ncbi:MAG: hypothetical protein H6747_10895 [Deltaproteobacteria bacterium]|nr:hypothetical protein [Deltaproteobacteria bacterium]